MSLASSPVNLFTLYFFQAQAQNPLPPPTTLNLLKTTALFLALTKTYSNYIIVALAEVVKHVYLNCHILLDVCFSACIIKIPVHPSATHWLGHIILSSKPLAWPLAFLINFWVLLTKLNQDYFQATVSSLIPNHMDTCWLPGHFILFSPHWPHLFCTSSPCLFPFLLAWNHQPLLKNSTSCWYLSERACFLQGCQSFVETSHYYWAQCVSSEPFHEHLCV